ncbi:hypothetical protein G3I19_21250 [Streptomyces sp. SID10853]|uniref:hypothetical protein n=1 Tax=Streptomyces sp. SID10853 TaxID=2706028 RepID=UPI0013C0F07D|nr:hypothetical protein [Streptomyces sp. SID10853]NDZ81015.1 hypothetical protein [Streptomyces sp. SID10853]
MRRFERWYGAGPLQLVVVLVSFAVAGYAGVRLLAGDWQGVVVWFIGAALVQDLVLIPLYSLADRALRALPGVARGGWINALRVPAALSGLLLLVWFPLILGPPARYSGATALPGGVFLTRWLLITAGLFAVAIAWRATRSLRGSSIRANGAYRRKRKRLVR